MNLPVCTYHLPVHSDRPIRLLVVLQSNQKKMLTAGAVLGVGDASVEIAVSSCFNLILGLENDLNMSDCSLFAADGLLVGFFSTSLCRSALTSGATAACNVDLVDLSLDVGRSDGLAAFVCSLLMPWLLLIAFSLKVSAEIGGAPLGGRFPVLRYKPHCQGLEGFNEGRWSLL